MARLLFFLALVLILILNPSTAANITYQLLSKIEDGGGGLPSMTIQVGSGFGWSVAGIGDVDEDGIDDLVVGAPLDDTGDPGLDPGAIYILKMHANYTVKDSVKIANGLGGLPNGTLANFDRFGVSISLIGDIDNDGVNDLAVGAPGTATNKGIIYILFLTNSGDIKSFTLIGDGLGGMPPGVVNETCQFGKSVAGIDDLNQDGFVDLAVGSFCPSGPNGEIFILNLNNTGQVISYTKITDGVNGVPAGILSFGDTFGSSIAVVEDLDGDGVIELIVGSDNDNTGGLNTGAAYLFYMRSNGTVKNYTKLAEGMSGIDIEALDNSSDFGRAATWSPGLELTNQVYVVFGSSDDTTGSSTGAIYITQLSTLGTVTDNLTKIYDGMGLPAGTLSNFDDFGISVASLPSPILNNVTSPGPLGQSVIAVGATGDQAVYIGQLTDPTGQVIPSNDDNDNPEVLAIALGVSLPVACCCLLLVVIPIFILIAYLTFPRAIKKARDFKTLRYTSEKDNYPMSDLEKTGRTNTSVSSSKLDWGDDNWKIDYQAIEMQQPPIASGAFGVVNKAKYRGTTVAVKTLIGNTQYEDLDEFAHEVELLSRIHHPNVVLFMGATEDPQAIVTEFVDRGSLYDAIKSGKLKSKHIQPIALGMAQGMAYLHGYKPPVIHRDLKSQNILITKNWLAKIADFGISRTVDTSQTMTRRVGTTRWTAPEVLEGGKYTEKADVYSYAIILWEILSGDGTMPFSDQKWEAKVEAKILEGERPDMPEVADELQPILEIMKSCWAQSADDRPTFDQIVITLES